MPDDKNPSANRKYDADDVVVAAARRTIVGSDNGSLKDLSLVEVGSAVLESILTPLEEESAAFRRDQIDQMILGHCIGAGTGQNLPRQLASRCGMDRVESAFVVNEMCGSSLEAIILASGFLAHDEYPLVLAGGVEMPAVAPWLISTRQLIDWKDRPVGSIQEDVVKADVFDALWCGIYQKHTIVHAEATTAAWAAERNLDPEGFKLEIDQWAVESHRRALEAAARGHLKGETALIPGTGEADELPKNKPLSLLQKRRGTQYTPEGLYLSNHNSPPLANCAAFLLMMKNRTAGKYGFTPLARIIGYARMGVVPEKYLLAPLGAVRKLLEKTGLSIGDFDLLELNTAFGSQMIINRMELGLDMEKVNIYGDCIAFGHPIGAAGARLSTTLLHALKNRGKRLGLVAMCLGGGNALAVAFERIE